MVAQHGQDEQDQDVAKPSGQAGEPASTDPAAESAAGPAGGTADPTATGGSGAATSGEVVDGEILDGELLDGPTVGTAEGRQENTAEQPVVTPEMVQAADEADAAAAAAKAGGSSKEKVPFSVSAELESLRGELEERVNDLQRVSAEFANYRRRVDRDRGVVVEQATGAVLAALLPVLDDLDRARDHGDLVGPFGTMADQLSAALAKFGLVPFGAKGEPFDPTRHEAVAHRTSADVKEPTCVEVMRRGYQLGERLLRPALVAVADPE